LFRSGYTGIWKVVFKQSFKISMATKNIVVIGGSYVGMNTAESLANASQGRFRVLLIEKNSHFQHLFAFPRYAVTTRVPTHKAFIPYQAKKLGTDGAIIQAVAIGLTKDEVHLDRSVTLDGESVDRIPFAALVRYWSGSFTTVC
jgi:NADH dehydrogenase FAD-containing subunit